MISRDGILKILGNEQNAASAKKLIEELTVLAKRGNTKVFSLFGQLLPCPTSPSLLRNATSPNRGGLGITGSSSSSPEAPLLGQLSNKVRLRGCTKGSLPLYTNNNN